MSFRPSFALAGDARKKTGGTGSAAPPRPVSLSKVHPLSRFRIADSTHSPISSACSSSPLHSVNLQSHPNFAPSTVVTSDRQIESQSTTVTVDNNFTSSSSACATHNSHHLRFSSVLSKPPAPLPTPKFSSRAPKMIASRFRPPVLASHRLRAWSSPFAVRQRQLLELSLPSSLVDGAYRVVHDAIAPSTKSTYAAGLLRFHQFCDAWCVDDEARMPASPALLAAFVGQCSGHYAGGTVRSWLSGIRAWHLTHNAEWHGDHEWIEKARVTTYKEGTAFKSPLRAPVSDDHLFALRRCLNLSLPFHAAVWAVATCTFFGCRRLGETTVKSASSFDPLYHATRSTTAVFRSLNNGSQSATIRIPWTKTTKHEGATIILTSRTDDLCPIAALRNHLIINGNPPSTISFFGYRSETGSWTHMFRNTFLPFVFRIWQSASLDHVAGHSFRIGGTVFLLLAGVPPEVVAATGTWTSLAFLRYWRKMEQIIPLCTSKAYNSVHISSLADTFERFRTSQGISRSAVDSPPD